MENGRAAKRVRFEITWPTIIKLLVGVLLGFIAVRVWPAVQLLTIAILVAVVLYRVVSWVCAKGWPRWLGLLLATLTLLAIIGALFGLIVPMVASEGSKLPGSLPKMKEQILAHVPENGPTHELAQSIFNLGNGQNSQRMLEKGLSMVKTTIGGLIDVVVVFALVIYLMADGPRALEWWIAFFPREKRARVSKGLDEIGDRIVAYVTGQFIVSALFATYCCILLSALKVPMALLLGVLAGMVDIVPILGILIALVPAALVALTVSPTKALMVVAGYLLYHGLEDYLIVPKVYGNKLKISTLAVLVAMLAGGVVAGVLGAIATLPMVAAYPALERLWFARRLEPEVVKDHEDLRAA
ncbi:MAG TPA: AI-2E family transporter [Verrucomicrobiae bacterium]|nr:AI-2E family transporter [Verrucomicrobiae bacterium]